MTPRRGCADDPREVGLKRLVKATGSMYDSANEALRCHRADPEEYDERTRTEATELCLRRVERLAKDTLDAIARLPR